MDSELKPCPFCGGEAEVIRPDGMEYVAECNACAMSGALHDTEAEAIAAWNTRALEQREAATPPRDVPDEEAVAKAMYEDECHAEYNPWEAAHKKDREVWLDRAASAIRVLAAAPSGEGKK